VGLEGGSWWAFVAWYVVANPLLEEIYWRGWLGSGSAAPVPNDVLFAGYHAVVLVLFIGWSWILVCFVTLVLAAWLWRRIAARTGGLAVCVAAHLVADASVIASAVILS
jgi:membrane protease YdiL (CAAX protease family)